MQHNKFNLQSIDYPVKSNLISQIKTMPMFNWATNEKLHEIKIISKKIKKKFKKVIVIGMGGSINAGISFASLYPNNIIFIDNIDPTTISNTLKSIKDIKEYFIIYISKSGKSEEILLLYEIFYKKFFINTNLDNVLIITQKENNPLIKIANKYQIFEHPNNIGGRFSYLTVVGLLVAEIANCDITKIIKSAEECINNYINHPITTNNYCKTLANKMINNQLHHFISMVYSDNLLAFNTWFQQLWAESLGKNNLGSVPISFSGTRDQHSQLQLYLANPQHKVFRIVQCEKLIADEFELINHYNKHANNVLNQLKNTGQIIDHLIIHQLNEISLSYLMTQAIIEVLLCAEFMQINPFNQEHVENMKKSIISASFQ